MCFPFHFSLVTNLHCTHFIVTPPHVNTSTAFALTVILTKLRNIIIDKGNCILIP